MNIGKNMKSLRTSELISQEKIATILGIKRSTYKEYELEYSIIPITHLNNFCNHFQISIDYIFNFNNTKKYANSKEKIEFKKSAKRLKEFRKEAKITQKVLSEILGIDNSTISKYEHEKQIIATQYLYAICKKYKISADYLLGKVDNPKYLK